MPKVESQVESISARMLNEFVYCPRLYYYEHVFECDLNSTELIGMQRELGEIILNTEDQVLFIARGPSEGRGDRLITALGMPYAKLDAPCYVV